MYVIVTTVQTFRHRYCIPVSACHTEDPRVGARDEVTMEAVKEFSQEHLGEQIVDSKLMTQEETLRLFNEDNPYLRSWTTEQKIRYLDNWQDNHA